MKSQTQKLSSQLGQFPQIAESSIIVLTGASSGLGREIAIKLARKRVTIILGGRNKERLDETKKICQSFQTAKIETIVSDISQQASCKYFIQLVVQKYKKIDILILNAGINSHFHFADLKDLKIYDTLMRTNFYANVYLTKYALNSLRKSNGLIIVISSISGKFGLPQRSAYCASKFALNGFFQSLRTQQQSISICMVYPTSLDTPMRNNDVLGAKVVASKQSKNKQQSSQKAAQFILKNVKKGHKDLFIPNKLWIGTALQPLFPNFMRRKLKQAAKL